MFIFVRLYRHLYNIMNLKVDIFKFQGFHRLEMPRFWLTTLPVVGFLTVTDEKRRIIESYNCNWNENVQSSDKKNRRIKRVSHFWLGKGPPSPRVRAPAPVESRQLIHMLSAAPDLQAILLPTFYGCGGTGSREAALAAFSSSGQIFSWKNVKTCIKE